MAKVFNRPIQLTGESVVPGSTRVTGLEYDAAGLLRRAEGASVPDAEAGYAIGCLFTETDGAAGSTVYVNEGTATSCTFRALHSEESVLVESATIATTGNTDKHIIAPFAGVLTGVDFSAVEALAANDTNYITFSLTNLGQDGDGTTAMLAASAANTTKSTGGTAIAALDKRSLTLHGTAANLVVAKGDRIRIRAAATGTLANTETLPLYMVRFSAT